MYLLHSISPVVSCGPLLVAALESQHKESNNPSIRSLEVKRLGYSLGLVLCVSSHALTLMAGLAEKTSSL